jgi:uncharacterized protein YbaP (TraB family)
MRGLNACAAALLLALGAPAHEAGAAGSIAGSSHAGSALDYRPYGSALVGPGPVAAPHQGGLFRVSDRGRVAYLFGTVHMGTAAFFPLPPEVSRALAEARQVVVELDTRSNDAFLRALARHGRYPPGDDLRRHLSPPVLAALTAALHAKGISVASMAGYKPWLVANLLLSMALERKGYRRDLGVEGALLTAAHKHGAAVTELESADYQLGLFDTLDAASAERYLQETLAGLQDGSAVRRAQAVVDAWAAGDARALDGLLHDATDGDSVNAEFTRRVLLGRRNPEMADGIARLMRRDSVTFVGVGVLHLLGGNGLPQLLAQRGYLVERVY